MTPAVRPLPDDCPRAVRVGPKEEGAVLPARSRAQNRAIGLGQQTDLRSFVDLAARDGRW